MSETKIEKTPTKLSAFYQNNKYILLSAGVSFLIFQLVAFCYDLVPFGDATILRMDLYHQYGPLFAELYDRLTSGESLIYSWNSGLGSSFLGNYFNYLSSPLTLVIILFGHKNITEAISFLIMIKAVLSSASFSYYLKGSLSRHSFATAAFGVLYSFCGYFVAYYWNLMWLDAMVLFPIIILGIERIINKGKPALYCISLAIMIFANYYMAYMICIFAVIYFFAYYFAHYSFTEKFEKIESDKLTVSLKNSLFFSSGVKFAFYSFVAACLAAIAIFPLITILSQSSATSSAHPTGFTKYFNAFDFLANHLASTDATIRSSGSDVLPNVYCGILTLILVPLYLFSKKVSLKEKVSYVALLAVLYFSFDINYLNFFWHGFHFPNDLPYRFSFMYSFVLLVIAYKALTNIREYTGRQLLATGTCLIFFIILVEELTSKNIDNISLIVSLVFAVGYVIILHLYKDKRFQTASISMLLICAVASEIALGNTNNYSMNQKKINYVSDYDDFKTIKSQIDEYDDNGFYRMELTNLRTRMDPCWFDYNGVSTFSSMAYESVANLQQDVGLYGNYINSYTYYPQTAVYNSLFGLKYVVDNNDKSLNPDLFDELFIQNKFTAYKNKYDLSVAFAANSQILSWNSGEYINPFTAQSELFRMASGVEDVFTRIYPDDVTYSNINDFYLNEFETGEFKFSKAIDNQIGSVCFEVTPQSKENLYIYFESSSIKSATISGSMFTESITALDEPYIIDLGSVGDSETIFVDISFKESANHGNLNFYAYTLNTDNFEQGYDILKNGNYNITNYSDTLLSGTINASQDGVVFTSIPYDINWRVYVDGVKLTNDQIHKISNSLLGFDISEGEHTVVLKFVSSGLIVGSFITAVTLLLSIIFIIMKRSKILFFKKDKQDKWLKLSKTGTEETFTVDFENLDELINDIEETE